MLNELYRRKITKDSCKMKDLMKSRMEKILRLNAGGMHSSKGKAESIKTIHKNDIGLERLRGFDRLFSSMAILK